MKIWNLTKNLAKSALLRAQNDITLAKEAFHRWPENHKQTFNSTGDEEMDNFLRCQKREEMERTKFLFEKLSRQIVQYYDNGEYQKVIDTANQIESIRISLE